MNESQHQVIYQQVVRAPSNGPAIAGMVLGIVAIVIGIGSPIPIIGLISAFFAFAPALLAAIFGHVGLSKARTMGGVGRGQATAGLTLGYLTLAIIVLTTAFWIVAIPASSSYTPS
ncbi:MAG: hypothetical protein CMF56_08670 [Leifsonia sp.]|nr:hypothetical protein [Leifsonia sp.]|tara:strand:- start:53361 stop:53708 length:348 start_codon:yes stop_codon:yes gene_type:complete